MILGLPTDFAPTVRAYLPRARAYLVAQTAPCIDVQREEIRRIDRNLEGGDFHALASYRPSSFMAVAILICGEEEVQAFLEWAYDRSWEELRRVFVYVPAEKVETWRMMSVRHDISFQLVPFFGFKDFHKDFGSKFNHVIYRDAQEPRKE